MREVWTEDDIFGGLYVIKESSLIGSTNLGFARTVTYKVGWTNTPGPKYSLISCLTDGWVCPIGDKKDMVNQLNLGEPGYRKLTKDEYLAMVMSSDQGFTDSF